MLASRQGNKPLAHVSLVGPTRISSFSIVTLVSEPEVATSVFALQLKGVVFLDQNSTGIPNRIQSSLVGMRWTPISFVSVHVDFQASRRSQFPAI